MKAGEFLVGEGFRAGGPTNTNFVIRTRPSLAQVARVGAWMSNTCGLGERIRVWQKAV